MFIIQIIFKYHSNLIFRTALLKFIFEQRNYLRGGCMLNCKTAVTCSEKRLSARLEFAQLGLSQVQSGWSNPLEFK